MRTTVELPPALMRAVKAQSAARGESMKTLLARALEAELGLVASETNERPRVSLPLFGDTSSGSIGGPSNLELERFLGDDDATHARAVETNAAGRKTSEGQRRP
jgi:hypothetical protein